MQIPPNSVLGKSNLILETVSAPVSLDFAVFRKFGSEVPSFGMNIDDEKFCRAIRRGGVPKFEGDLKNGVPSSSQPDRRQ